MSARQHISAVLGVPVLVLLLGLALVAPAHGDPSADPEPTSTAVPDQVREEMEAHWRELGGADGPLGSPQGDPVAIPGGARWEFTGGALFRADPPPGQPGKVSAVLGDTLQRYDEYDGPQGRLGFPKDDPGDLGDGATRQDFAGGTIWYSPRTGAHAVHGPALQRYLALDGPSGRLGFPVSEVVPAGKAGSTGPERINFENGRIYYSARTGAHEVIGAVSRRYVALRGAAGRLGLPTSNQVNAGKPRSERVNFQNGRIYYSARTGAHSVIGAISRRYVRLHGAAGRLGLPKGEERRVKQGRRQHFQSGDLLLPRGATRALVRLPFSARGQRVTRAQVPYTWRPGCPVPPKNLRMLHIVHRDWRGDDQVGRLVVNAGVVGDIRTVFRRAHAVGFPIRRMVPADRWRGSDVRAMENDSTNAFNCRHVTGNPYRLSQHSYGNAVDINSFENPYVTGSRVYPQGSRTYLNRSWVRKGMIVGGGVIARNFASLGWPWGARWANPDYQHFSSNGG